MSTNVENGSYYKEIPVLSRKYWSTAEEVLEYFFRSTETFQDEN